MGCYWFLLSTRYKTILLEYIPHWCFIYRWKNLWEDESAIFYFIGWPVLLSLTSNFVRAVGHQTDTSCRAITVGEVKQNWSITHWAWSPQSKNKEGTGLQDKIHSGATNAKRLDRSWGLVWSWSKKKIKYCDSLHVTEDKRLFLCEKR